MGVIAGEILRLMLPTASQTTPSSLFGIPFARRIRFTNPYRQAIAGTFKLRGPAGWTINPPTHTFTLNPGETLDRELTLEFPYNSFAGGKTLTADQGGKAGTKEFGRAVLEAYRNR